MLFLNIPNILFKIMDRFTLLYLKQITNMDILYSTGKSAECYVAVWMGGEQEDGYMCMYD